MAAECTLRREHTSMLGDRIDLCLSLCAHGPSMRAMREMVCANVSDACTS